MEISKKLQHTIRTYEGDLKLLETAVGAYVIGQMYGHRVISVCHSPSTVARCNRILGFQLQEVCPAITPLSMRVNGIRLAKKLGDFWDIARSHNPGKRLVGDDNENQPELSL